jgi:HAD superfamily hydrolase (TIGR01549 family)
MTPSFDLSRLRAVVFDVDGTLYPHRPLRRAMALLLLLNAVARPRRGVVALRVLRAYREAQEHLREAVIDGSVATAQLRLACERSGICESDVAEIVTAWMEQAPIPILSRLVDPAVRDLLDALRSRGVRLGVLSDYPAEAKLRALDLAEHFHTIVSAQDPAVNCFKPHPRGLLETLKRLDVAPADALYVGDRHDVDAPTARAAGVACVIVRRRSAAPGATWTHAADFRALHAALLRGGHRA